MLLRAAFAAAFRHYAATPLYTLRADGVTVLMLPRRCFFFAAACYATLICYAYAILC